ncbi:DNA mismatch repair endonuclease MutL [Desulfallas sp. Bu1-1]|uniref:DNA mismatch repair endonuclease MutL n=1 Tax=Desulfallas sp. Bu1-1 TaxID=2787620 RepID=UPI00189D84E7|nr:DNA mismatch repair endonuclease MutL [Desulfallas sp. Bu1-1]MBF7083356.1 DNA mismatch repair endonuclease MutL [Desulfallas sp. Bu1-1]
MPKIIVLDEETACRIAAGEVVERPVSVVKELVENALDAGADSINISVRGGGIDFISVIDNGCGISQEDTPLAFQRHATSKIKHAGDLDRIETLGFRGEALPSIAAVSDVSLKTRVPGNNEGYHIRVHGGKVMESGPVGCPAGTSVTVRDIFFNTPARRKHLRSRSTEAGLINDLVYKLALINPRVKFTLEHNGREILRTPGSGKTLDALVSVYGLNAAEMLVPVSCQDSGITMEGYVGKPDLSRSTRQQITLAVNGRVIRSPLINNALEEAYRGVLTTGRYPVAVLSFRLPPEMVDVNVHPSKMEIKIDMEDKLTSLVTQGVRRAMKEVSLVPSIKRENFGEKKLPPTSEPFRLNLASQPSRPAESTNLTRKTSDTSFTRNPGDAPETSVASVAENPPHAPHYPFKPGNEADTGAVGEKYRPDEGERGEQVAETRMNYHRQPFPELQVVGQLMNMYIVAGNDEGIYIIDQHAAHERILFEKYNQLLSEGSPEIQFLLTPVHIDLRIHEKDIIREYKASFEALGFVFEDFGRDSLLLRGIPADCSAGEGERIILDLVETIMVRGKVNNNRVNYELASIMACKAAVKGGERLSADAMQVLVNRLARAGEPYTCPHGRPTVISITRRELDAMFKRT